MARLPARRGSENRRRLSLVLGLTSGASHAEVLEALQRCARTQFNVAHVTVQLEGEGCGDPDAHA